MQYDLVFEGGGGKGPVLIGALMEFIKRGHIARRFVGTSAGAIAATLMAAGYTPEEMLQLTTEKLSDGKPIFSSFMDMPTKFSQEDIKESLTYTLFNKIKLPNWIKNFVFSQLMRLEVYRQLFSFIERGGLYSGDVFLNWIKKCLEQKEVGLGEASLLDFNKRTNNDISLVASDTTGEEMLVLNHRTAPDCPIAYAVRMSMSIPFVWQEVEWQREWGKYLDRDITGHIIVDGGVLSNFPIDLLTSSNKRIKRIMGGTDPYAVPNLGLLIDEKKTVKGSGKPKETGGNLFSSLGNLKTVKRINALLETMMNARDNTNIRNHKKEICRLPAKGYGVVEFDMEDERLLALINAGSKAMEKHFDSHP